MILFAVIFAVLAALYATGAIGFLATGGHRNHYTHAFVMGRLALLGLVGASFARPQRNEPH